MEKLKTKPIFIIGLHLATMHEIAIIEEKTKHITDYHVLIIKTDYNEPIFKVFYEKDFNKIKFDELKEIVKKGLK